MSIEGLGIDLIEIDRIKRALDKWGDRFEERILTPEERSAGELRSTQRATFVAGRFASKEAIFKALGFNPGWHAVEILPTSSGRPVVGLKSLFVSPSGRPIERVMVSITHSRAFALAQAIALGTHDTG